MAQEAIPEVPPEAASAVDAARERLGPKLEEAQEQLGRLNENVKAWVKKNPGAAIAAAAVAGYLVGRLVSRR